MIAALRTLLSVALLLLAGTLGSTWAQDPPRFPTAPEVQDLLAKEPFSDATWPAWRQRLQDWFGDKSRGPDEAYWAAGDFLKSKLDAAGELPPPYDRDHLAWYFLSLADRKEAANASSRAAVMKRSEYALRRSLEVDPKFARAHRNLAAILLMKGGTE